MDWFASIEAWQPTINTLALIVLALVGGGTLKVHNVRLKHKDQKIEELAEVTESVQDIVKRIEKLLDDSSGPEFSHLH